MDALLSEGSSRPRRRLLRLLQGEYGHSQAQSISRIVGIPTAKPIISPGDSPLRPPPDVPDGLPRPVGAEPRVAAR